MKRFCGLVACEIKICNMKNNMFITKFDEREFIIVCRKSDYESGNIGDGVFLVYRNEWEDTDDFSMKKFKLLLTSVERGVVKLYLTQDNEAVVFQSLHYSRRSEYMPVE